MLKNPLLGFPSARKPCRQISIEGFSKGSRLATYRCFTVEIPRKRVDRGALEKLIEPEANGVAPTQRKEADAPIIVK